MFSLICMKSDETRFLKVLLQSNTAILGNAINTFLMEGWGNKSPVTVVIEVGKMYLHHGGERNVPLEHGSDFRVEK